MVFVYRVRECRHTAIGRCNKYFIRWTELKWNVRPILTHILVILYLTRTSSFRWCVHHCVRFLFVSSLLRHQSSAHLSFDGFVCFKTMIPWVHDSDRNWYPFRQHVPKPNGNSVVKGCVQTTHLLLEMKEKCGRRWNWKLRFRNSSHTELIRYVANNGDPCHNLRDERWSYHFAVCLISGNFNFIVNKLGVRPTIEAKCFKSFASIRCIFFSKNNLSVNNTSSCVSRLVRKCSVLPYAFDNLGQTNLNLPLKCGFPSTDE